METNMKGNTSYIYKNHLAFWFSLNYVERTQIKVCDPVKTLVKLRAVGKKSENRKKIGKKSND